MTRVWLLLVVSVLVTTSLLMMAYVYRYDIQSDGQITFIVLDRLTGSVAQCYTVDGKRVSKIKQGFKPSGHLACTEFSPLPH